MCSCTKRLIIYNFRMTMCSSIFLLIASAVERYLAVCRPHHYRQVGIHWNSTPSSLFSLILDQRSSLERICLHSPQCGNCFPNKHYKVKKRNENPSHKIQRFSFRFYETEVVRKCWDYTDCGCGNEPW